MEENIREDLDASAKTVFHLKKIYSFLFIEGFIGVRVDSKWPDKSCTDSEPLFCQTSRECFGKRKAIENDIMSINLMQPYLTSQV